MSVVPAPETKRRPTLPAALTVALFLCTSCVQSPDVAPESRPLTARTFDPIELSFATTEPVTAEFESAGGRQLRTLSFGRGGQRVVRFTPPEPGVWRYTAGTRTRTVGTGHIEASPSDSRGFVNVHGQGFARDDGTPFVAIGENRINIYDPSWNWSELSVPEYIRHMASHGMTVLRVFIVSDIENEERGGGNAGVLEPEVGRFDEQVASQFDEIFRAAEAHGIGIILVAFALGFSEDDPWKSWEDNPYSRERGGPAASRYEFFESRLVRARAAERIRYIAARYAASPSFLALDLLNEPEWDGEIPEVSWGPWAEHMARVWDEADPYERPVTVGSVGLHWNIEGDERPWWNSTACDIVQWHLYGKEVYDVHALAQEMTRKVRESWNHGKPIIVGEFAWGGEPKPEYDHTHVGLWSASFSGAGVLAHSAPPFNIDSDEPMTPERARHFQVLNRVLTRLGNALPLQASAADGISAWALGNEQRAAIWLLAPQSHYESPVQPARIRVTGLASGTWRIRWFDDVTGEPLGDSEVTTSGQVLHVQSPSFSRHVVGELQRD